MNAFTISHPVRVRRILVDLKVCAAFDPNQPPAVLPDTLSMKALWDTGATNSLVTAGTAAKLGLVPAGQVMMNHAGGCSPSNTYVVNLILPNSVGIAGVQVSECPDNAGDFGAIIGMDVITQGDLSLSHAGGKTVMSFRNPSLFGIDYVAEINRTRFAGVGRNEPCPCGRKDDQGRPVKYKFCHGKNGQSSG